jgi:chaperonin GroES|tara:strand:- start:295 stop:564 length:270 start_codon:yes stop_codon:yes gene_type:complete
MLEPLLDRIIVEPVKKEDRTESGIILPDTAQDTGAPQQASVVEVGKDCATIEKGDTVLFAKFTGIEVQYEGRTLMVIPEKEILARVKNG